MNSVLPNKRVVLLGLTLMLVLLIYTSYSGLEVDAVPPDPRTSGNCHGQPPDLWEVKCCYWEWKGGIPIRYCQTCTPTGHGEDCTVPEPDMVFSEMPPTPPPTPPGGDIVGPLNPPLSTGQPPTFPGGNVVNPQDGGVFDPGNPIPTPPGGDVGGPIDDGEFSTEPPTSSPPPTPDDTTTPPTPPSNGEDGGNDGSPGRNIKDEANIRDDGENSRDEGDGSSGGDVIN